MNRIPDEKIKAIASEYLTNGMIKSKALQTVGYSKNYAEHGGLKLFDNDRLKEEIARQQAKIEKISEISVISEQQKLLEIAEAAFKDKRYAAAVSAHCAIIKTIGGFQAEKQPVENLAGKVLDAKKAEDMRKIADMYYASKYLAPQAVKEVESTEIKPDISNFPISSLPDSNNLTPDSKPVDLAPPVQQNAQFIP